MQDCGTAKGAEWTRYVFNKVMLGYMNLHLLRFLLSVAIWHFYSVWCSRSHKEP